MTIEENNHISSTLFFFLRLYFSSYWMRSAAILFFLSRSKSQNPPYIIFNMHAITGDWIASNDRVCVCELHFFSSFLFVVTDRVGFKNFFCIPPTVNSAADEKKTLAGRIETKRKDTKWLTFRWAMTYTSKRKQALSFEFGFDIQELKPFWKIWRTNSSAKK